MKQRIRRLWLLGPARVADAQGFRDADQPMRPPAFAAGTMPRFRSRRTVALLGYLAAERRTFARDKLAALFWPDAALSIGRANLRRELYNLTQILPDCWELDRRSVAFVPSKDTIVDVYLLLDLVAQARWDDAVELLRGDFLEGLVLDQVPEFENWLLAERERWRRSAETILMHVAEVYARQRRYTEALPYSRRLVQLNPWNEEAIRQLMRLLAWTGQSGAALRQFKTCKQTLQAELGVQPSEETVGLYRQIQNGNLQPPPSLPAFLIAETAPRAVTSPCFVAREQELSDLAIFLYSALAGDGRVAFISGGPGTGKTALLNTFSRTAIEAHTDLLVACGNCNAYSGVGDPYLPFRDVMGMLSGDVEAKWAAGAISTSHARRLWAAVPMVVETLLDHVALPMDVLVSGVSLVTRAESAEQRGAAWVARLKERVERQGADVRNQKQSILFDQFTNVLRAVALKQPLLLLLDDVQWADTASISLLFHLARRLAQAKSRILILCAYRSDEVDGIGPEGRHPLGKLLSECRRAFGNVWVDLDPDDPEQGRHFVDALLDVEPNCLSEGFRTALHRRTQGHPLFTVELLRAMRERGDLVRRQRNGIEIDGAWVAAETLDWEVLPAQVEAVIQERIARLDPEMQETLAIASVEGEAFTAQVVARLQQKDERSLIRRMSTQLDQRHHLVIEQEENRCGSSRLVRFRFSHVLFQEYVYRQIGAAERRFLHREVADALYALHEGRLEEMAVQLAHHYHQAGDDEHALRFFTMAAEHAAQIYASDQAIVHYTRSIEFAQALNSEAAVLSRLYLERGIARGSLGEFDCARADLEEALDLAQGVGTRELEWRALLRLGRLWYARDYRQAWRYLNAALQLARRIGAPQHLARSLNWIGNWHANEEDPHQAVAHHREALELMEDSDLPQDLGYTLDLLGIASLLAGDLGESVRYYDRAVSLFRELGDRQGLISSLVGRGTTVSMMVLLASASPHPCPTAEKDISEAISIARELGSQPDEAWAYWSQGLLHTVRGRFGCALEAMQQGLYLADEIDHREWKVATRFALGVLHNEFLAPEAALLYLDQAFELAKELQSRYWIHHVIGALAGAEHLSGDYAAAHNRLQMAISAGMRMDTMGKRYCWTRIAELALGQHEPATALDITDRLIASAPGLAPDQVISCLWKLKGEALDALGESDVAGAMLRAAINNAQVTGERFLIWRSHASLARVYRKQGRYAEAEAENAAARVLVSEMANSIPDDTLRANFLERATNAL